MTTQAPPNRRTRTPHRTGQRPKRETIKTWVFDSVGNRKYAVQLQKASNGNPCLRIVEGVPGEDGSYRKFNVTFWSEDFGSLFEALHAARGYIESNNIRTPPGHKWTPKPTERRRGPSGRSGRNAEHRDSS